MPQPRHYFVMDGQGNGRSDYTIEATGDIDQVEGQLGGVPVSKDAHDRVSGSTVNGTVWAQADGYRVYGGLKSIEVENPDHVQVHTGEIAAPQDSSGEHCEVTVRAEKVEFIEGQGLGEGALELQIEHDIHGAQSENTSTKLPTGATKNLGASIDNFEVPVGGTLNKQLTTKVTEREVPADWFTGHPDHGSATMDLSLECGEPQTVSQNVRINSDRDNPGEVKVYYTIGDLSG